MDILAQLTEKIREKVGHDSGLKATLKFVLDEGKVIYVDATQVPNVVSNEDKPADCTIKLSPATLHELLQKRTSPTTAFMLGKLKVEGSMGIALQLTKLL
ncbi:MAG: SCP2 sterol-binding domain-containing protein [Bacteroidia bacterium]